MMKPSCQRDPNSARALAEPCRTRSKARCFCIGIRDVILPGEMKNILNRMTEARKAPEATLITRREETAAVWSQASTVRIGPDASV